MNLLSDLNEMQKEAVLQTEGPLLILAGAGSGKTKTIIHRIVYILMQNLAKPYQILSLTFTNKAAGEMKERIAAFNINDTADLWMGTFHSICAKLLRINAKTLGFSSNFSIYDEEDSKKLLKECLAEINTISDSLNINQIRGIISKAKDNLLTPYDFLKANEDNSALNKIHTIYDLYQKKLKENNAMDFDDLLMNTVILFKENPHILSKYQNQFKYILVDEYQDTNHSQYVLISMLAKEHQNICVCGDDDQSIYGWRGADIRNILEFEEDFPNAKIIRLEQNYRCTKTVLEAANNVIQNNKGRKGKTLWTENETGDKISLISPDRDLDEAFIISNEIVKLFANGINYKNIAVLYRTNAQSRILEEGLLRKGIPYQIVGGIKFYERLEIKDILAYLKLLINPNDNISFIRIINIPKRGIGPGTIDKLKQYAEFKDTSLYEAAQSASKIPTLSTSIKEKINSFSDTMKELANNLNALPLHELIKKTIKSTGYEMMLKEGKIENWQDRLSNLEELINAATDFEETSEDSSLQAFLENASLIAGIDTYNSNAGKVLLMTLHNAKGLEFDTVFIPGMEEHLFPLEKASQDPSELEEERRLCYVGITRAKRKLYLLSCKTRKIYGSIQYRLPSRFLEEIPSELIYSSDSNINSHAPFSNASQQKKSRQINYNDNYAYKKTIKKEATLTTDKNCKAGDIIEHSQWGIGTVINITGDGKDAIITAAFAGLGIKKFVSGFADFKKINK